MNEEPRTTVRIQLTAHGHVSTSDAGRLESWLRTFIELARAADIRVEVATLRRGDDVVVGTQFPSVN